MKTLNKYLVKVTMYTTPHYIISAFMAALMVCIHGGSVTDEEFETLAEAVTNEIMDSNLFTKLVIIIIWYGIYFAIFNKYFL